MVFGFTMMLLPPLMDGRTKEWTNDRWMDSWIKIREEKGKTHSRL